MASTYILGRAGRRSFSSSSSLHAKVGFIGLGNMGRHMANNLLKNGHQVTVYDLSKTAVEDLVSKGAKSAAAAADVARDVDAVVTMLPSSPHVKSVYEGSDGSGSSTPGLIAVAKKGTLLLDCSTIDPNVARSVNAAATAKGLKMLDAPVSGGVNGAEAGTLTFMVGAPDVASFDLAKQLLAAMGKNIVHVGGPGTGQVAKIVNNLILGISMVGVSEAMNLGVKMGADPKVLAGIINTSSGRCWSSDTYNPVPGVMPNTPASRGYNGGFGSALMAKDLGLAIDAARSVSAPLPAGSAALATYELMKTQGLGGKDFAAAYAFLSGSLPGPQSK